MFAKFLQTNTQFYAHIYHLCLQHLLVLVPFCMHKYCVHYQVSPQWCCSQDCYVHNVRFTYKYCIHPAVVILANKNWMFATFGRTILKVYLNRREPFITRLFIEHVREIFANIRLSVRRFLRSVLQHFCSSPPQVLMYIGTKASSAQGLRSA